MHSNGTTPKVKKILSKLIDKINGLRGPILKINYKPTTEEKPKLKTKFVIATRNIIWRKVDVENCEGAGIAILRQEENRLLQATCKNT